VVILTERHAFYVPIEDMLSQFKLPSLFRPPYQLANPNVGLSTAIYVVSTVMFWVLGSFRLKNIMNQGKSFHTLPTLIFALIPRSDSAELAEVLLRGASLDYRDLIRHDVSDHC